VPGCVVNEETEIARRMSNQPLVSIGLPTFNRAATLERAIESSLSQDYQNLELVIFDNASTDDTEATCLAAAQKDHRVKYFRRPTNLGMVSNFCDVLDHSSGEFFMWLGDDDWIDPSYVGRCLEVLNAHSDYALVSGEAKYYEDDRLMFEGERIELLQQSGADRVLAYYERVLSNGIFYGLMRRGQINSAWIRNELGGDWHVIAAMAFKGKITTIGDITVSRSHSASRTMKGAIETLGISNMHSYAPTLSIALNACRDIAWRSSAFDSLSRGERFALARRVLAVFNRRFFKPYWWTALYPYWTRPILLAISLRNKIRKRNLD